MVEIVVLIMRASAIEIPPSVSRKLPLKLKNKRG
jgi:hypothetical protein